MTLALEVQAFRDSLAAGAAYGEAFDRLVAASKTATFAERDAAILALLAHASDHPEITGLASIASGALVEDGASATLGLDTLYDRMADGAALLAAADLDDADLDAHVAPPSGLPQDVRRWVAAWKSHVRGAMARLARDVGARTRLRAHPRFEPAVRTLAERTWAHHLRYIVEVLDMLDDEPLTLVDLARGGTITRYRARGIRNGFHLMTILDGHDPVRLRCVNLVTARAGYYTWPALAARADGFVAEHLGYLLWGEPRARDLPRFEGVRTIIRAPATLSRSWDTSFVVPIHDALREELVVETELSPAEARPVLERIAAAARGDATA